MQGVELAERIAAILTAITAPGAPLPPAGDQPVLADLFRALVTQRPARERAEAEDLIWALWTAHPDDGLSRRMNKAIGAMARRDLSGARAMLDALVLDAPRWAEAWNKRATLHFLEERDLDSVRDIERTLALEPRHFGAMSGLGQICLRCGDEVSALIAFQAALRVNPNLESVREGVAALERRLRRTMH